jgi:hypothetical protein
MGLAPLKEGEREVCLRLLGRVNCEGPLLIVRGKGCTGAEFEADAAEGGPHLAPLQSSRGDLLDGKGHLRP